VKVSEVCSHDVVFVAASESVVEAAKIMRRCHVGDVVVVKDDNGRGIGVLTDRDITVELVAAEVDPATVSVGDILTRNLVSVKENDDIYDALVEMTDHAIRRIPVEDVDGRLVGILSLDDIVQLLADELHRVSTLLERQPRDEKFRGFD
jgi:CBS domain-containing protein